MEIRQRLIVGSLWIGVAALMAFTLEPGALSTPSAIVRLFVVVVALFLAGVYLLNPLDVLDRHPFH